MVTSVTLLHFILSNIFGFITILIIILSDILIIPYLLHLQSIINPESSDIQLSRGHNHSELLHTSESQKIVSIEFEPFASSNPFLFGLVSHSFIMIVLPIYYALRLIRRISRFPRLSTMRKRLKGSGSKVGNLIAHINEQFDDCVIEGRLTSIENISSFLLIGLTTTTLFISMYLWRKSLFYASVPLGSAFSYSYILILSPLTIPFLSEKLHGLKLLSSISCFIGIFIFYFPEASITSDHTMYDIIIAMALGILSALTFSLYLVFYSFFNPDGWMLKVMGFQGIGVFLFGSIFATVLHFTNIERFALPTQSSDIHTIIFHGLSRCFIIYCMNESLRWGETLTIATALTIVPPSSYIAQTVFVVNSPPLTLPKIMSLIFTLSGFLLVATYQLFRSLRGIAKKRQSISSERKRLVIGSDYVI